MKHDGSPREWLACWSERTQTDLPSDRVEVLLDLIEWAAPAAARLGLTRYDTATEYTRYLILPSLALAEAAGGFNFPGPALDFGAGAGAVGLCWTILRPDLQTVLADRRGRVVQFIDLCLRRFGATNGRAQLIDLSAPPAETAQGYGLIWLRAYAPGPEALQQARLWLRPEGWVAFWHQPPAPEPPGDLIKGKTIATAVDSLVLTVYFAPPAEV